VGGEKIGGCVFGWGSVVFKKGGRCGGARPGGRWGRRRGRNQLLWRNEGATDQGTQNPPSRTEENANWEKVDHSHAEEQKNWNFKKSPIVKSKRGRGITPNSIGRSGTCFRRGCLQRELHQQEGRCHRSIPAPREKPRRRGPPESRHQTEEISKRAKGLEEPLGVHKRERAKISQKFFGGGKKKEKTWRGEGKY